MPARRLLVAYGTSYGQTARIAARIAELLSAWGHAVTLADVGALSPATRLADFEGVVIGGSITFGTHQRRVRRFVRAHRAELNAMPSAFFSVSGSAASRDPAVRTEARRMLDGFLRDTGWRPAAAQCIGGAIAYTRYDPLTRWALRRISAREGGPTDTTRDHELTDWAQVGRFAEAVAAAYGVEREPEPAPDAASSDVRQAGASAGATIRAPYAALMAASRARSGAPGAPSSSATAA